MLTNLESFARFNANSKSKISPLRTGQRLMKATIIIIIIILQQQQQMITLPSSLLEAIPTKLPRSVISLVLLRRLAILVLTATKIRVPRSASNLLLVLKSHQKLLNNNKMPSRAKHFNQRTNPLLEPSFGG